MADDQHQFVVDYPPYKNEGIVQGPCTIRPEDIKEENIFLLTETDLHEQNFQIVDDLNFQNNNFSFHALTNALGENYPKLPLDTEFKTEAVNKNLKSHFIKYRVHDGKHTKVWVCGICSKEFGHQYTLMRHLPTHTDERKFQCNTCGKAFRQMSTLSQHRAIHSAERPYVCEVCQKTFNRVSTLISHRKTHTGQKPHQCHLCNKAFHQKGNLRNHIFTHTNERPYKCDICHKGFNQTSNLMCHKLKAHQRVDKPKHTCQICGKEFQKRMGLRNHEQYQHGLQIVESGTSSDSPRIRYTNGVLVDPIKTAAMQLALATNQTPFALLRPSNGIPVLVRVLPAGDKQMLVPATAEDLKKHGQISITAKTEDGSPEEDTKDPLLAEKAIKTEAGAAAAAVGSTVQIKIPVVATVVQRRGKDGNVCMAVQSPGPDGNGVNGSSCVFTTTGDEVAEGGDGLLEDIKPLTTEVMLENGNVVQGLMSDAQIEYIDESGTMISEEEFQDASRYFQQQSYPYGNIPSMFAHQQKEEDQENVSPNNIIVADDMLNIDNGNNLQMFKMLEKPQDLGLEEQTNGNQHQEDSFGEIEPTDYVFN